MTTLMADDPYKILNVSRSATDTEIRSAYRKLAKQLHPDMNPGDKVAEDKFKRVAAAFRILGDPQTRGRFDRGEIDANGQERPESRFYRGFGNRSGGKPSGRTDDFSSFSDLFGDLFGDGAKTQFDGRGGDLRYTLDIEFLEAVQGAKKRIILPEGGTLDLNVPAGVTDGQVLRLKGKGQSGVGTGPAGDALIEVKVKPHAYFQREGDDIVLELPISLSEAVLGAKVEVPTINGRVSIVIPKGSSTGKLLRLRGKGVYNKRANKTGDQLLRLKIVLPDVIDQELESLISKWSKTQNYNPRKGL